MCHHFIAALVEEQNSCNALDSSCSRLSFIMNSFIKYKYGIFIYNVLKRSEHK